MISPFEIFLEAQMALCHDPAWMHDLDGAPYPQPIHMAHRVNERAATHLGIRALDGYAGRISYTDALDAILQETLASVSPQAGHEGLWF